MAAWGDWWRLGRLGGVPLIMVSLMMTAAGGKGSPGPDSRVAPTVSKSPSDVPAHTLVLDLTGQGTIRSVTYVVNGDSKTENSVRPPWRKSIALPSRNGIDSWSLDLLGESGSLRATAYVDGTAVSIASSEGSNGENHLEGTIGGSRRQTSSGNRLPAITSAKAPRTIAGTIKKEISRLV
jgi:hypothetical protein